MMVPQHESSDAGNSNMPKRSHKSYARIGKRVVCIGCRPICSSRNPLGVLEHIYPCGEEGTSIMSSFSMLLKCACLRKGVVTYPMFIKKGKTLCI